MQALQKIQTVDVTTYTLRLEADTEATSGGSLTIKATTRDGSVTTIEATLHTEGTASYGIGTMRYESGGLRGYSLLKDYPRWTEAVAAFEEVVTTLTTSPVGAKATSDESQESQESQEDEADTATTTQEESR